MHDDNVRVGQLEAPLQDVEVVWFGLLAFGDDKESLAGRWLSAAFSTVGLGSAVEGSH